MDLVNLTNEDLDALRVSVINEIERRQRLATIPTTIAQLAAQFVAGGGNLAEIADAVATAEPTNPL